VLDLASLAPRDCFPGHAGHRHEYIGANPLRYAGGGYRYRTGMTTLGIWLDYAIAAVGVAPRFRVYVNNVVRIDTPLVSGLQVYTATGMGSWGLSDGQVVEVRMELYVSGGGAELATGQFYGITYLVDAHVSPASGIITEPWPGTPTFTTGPDEAKLLQLSNAADWLARRMSVVSQPLWVRVISAAGGIPWWAPEAGEPIRSFWSGGLIRGPYDRLRARTVWIPGSGASQRLRVVINGTEVATTATFGPGGWGQHNFDISLAGYGAASVLRVEFQYVVAATGAASYAPRISLEYMEAHRSAPAFVTLTNRPESFELTTWAARRDRLNQIAAALAAIKSRIDADVDRWDRIRLFRSPYGYDVGQATYFRGRHQTIRRKAAGRRLIVRGSNISLGWGPPSYTLTEKKDPLSEYEVAFAGSESLVSGDTVETREVMLGACEGLEPGFPFIIYGGDVRYAAEEL
jgi:hypothetical protein